MSNGISTGSHASQCALCSSKSANCKCGKDGCELTTITASQLGAFIVFSTYLFVNLFSVLTFSSYDTLHKLINILILYTYSISLIYFFLGCMATEEQFIDDLRDLKRGMFPFQWIIRILIFILLGFYSTITTPETGGILFDLFSEKDAIFLNLYFLIILNVSFIIWDFSVMIGLKWKVIKPFFFLDIASFSLHILAVVIYKYCALHWMAIPLIGLGAFGLIALYIMNKYNFFNVFRRITIKNQIR